MPCRGWRGACCDVVLGRLIQMRTDQSVDPIIIRRARVHDADAVHAVLLSGKNDIPLTEKFDSQPYREWVRGECRRQSVWIAERNGAIAGVMVMAVAEIFYLVTAPTHRRCGVAQKLIRHAVIEIERRYERGVTAKVREANFPIIEVLRSEGFTPHPILTAEPGWNVYSLGKVR